jgi:hypothetical protein
MRAAASLHRHDAVRNAREHLDQLATRHPLTKNDSAGLVEARHAAHRLAQSVDHCKALCN